MKTAIAIAVALLATSAYAAGFTQKEIDALPKPDPIVPGPHFFTGPNKAAKAKSLKAGSAALISLRASTKATKRRQRLASRVDQPDWGMLQVQAMAARVWHGGLP